MTFFFKMKIKTECYGVKVVCVSQVSKLIEIVRGMISMSSNNYSDKSKLKKYPSNNIGKFNIFSRPHKECISLSIELFLMLHGIVRRNRKRKTK